MHFWIGIGSAVFAVFSFIGWIMETKRLRGFKKFPAKNISELVDIDNYISDEIGAGSFREKVKIKGIATCENPVVSLLSKQECIYSSTTVNRVYNQKYRKINPKTGETVIEWKAKEKLLQSNKTMVRDFYISDFKNESQKIFISTQDNKPYGYNNNEILENEAYGLKTVLDEKILYDNKRHGLKFKYKDLDIDLLSVTVSEDEKTTGFHLIEKVIPVHSTVFAYGVIDDKYGKLRMTPEKESKNEFFLSFRDEDKSKGMVKTAVQGLIMIFFIFSLLSALFFYLNYT